MDKEDVIKEGAVNHPVAEEANEPILNNEFVKNKVSTERNYGNTSISHSGVVKNQVDTNNRPGKKNSFVESTPSSSLATKDENDQVLTPRKLKSLNSGQERSEAELSDLTKKKTYCVKVDADVD
ncbi:hypothetical protein CQW23_20611 [Capsicum baccatum]|uniref:Uncharacterized protein n=1 Tax=Capsicum baccatum TaxID=33114 RepID=A0A2G2W972_CAPBA|nr:hypothetical protein CQW23_20611 [Capsicum baccatum]